MHMSRPQRPAALTTALVLAGLGAVLAVSYAAFGVYVAKSALDAMSVRPFSEDDQYFTMLLTRLLVFTALAAAVWWLCLRLVRNRSGRAGLAVLMFGVPPFLVANFFIDVAHALQVDIDLHEHDQPMAPAAELASAYVTVSLLTSFVLAMLALVAAVLLLAPSVNRHLRAVAAARR